MTDNNLWEKWENIIESLGYETVLNAIAKYVSSDELAQFIEWLKADYDLDCD